MIRAWRLITAGLGVPIGEGCACALCGSSPHAPAKSVREFLPAHFPHPELIDESRESVCAGCVALFGGKPSREKPPLRMRHLVVRETGELLLFDRVRPLREFLERPESAAVMSWSTSLQKHHFVHARARRPGLDLLIGSDAEPLRYGLAERAALPAVHELLLEMPMTEVIEGEYSSVSISGFGATRWAELEEIVDPVRRRSPLLLELMVYATLPEKDTKIAARAAAKNERRLRHVLTEVEDLAVHVLGEIARASAMRREDGLVFWKGFFRHRVARFSRLQLHEFTSRLMAECRVESHAAEAVTSALRLCTGMEAKVMAVIKTQSDLMSALAYDYVQDRKGQK